VSFPREIHDSCVGFNVPPVSSDVKPYTSGMSSLVEALLVVGSAILHVLTGKSV